MRCKTIACLLITISAVALALGFAAEASNPQSYFFFEYGSSGCPHCVPQHKFLLKYYGEEHHYFCDVATNRTCLMFYVRYINRTKLPPLVPQTLVFVDGRLVAVVIGENQEKPFWDSLITSGPSTQIPVYFGSTPKKYLNVSESEMPELIKYVVPPPYSSEFVEELTTHRPNTSGNASSREALSLWRGFMALVPLALADSVNPCTFTLYAAVLAAASVGAGRRKMVWVGTAFISAVFIGYLALGILLSEGASFVPKVWLGAIAAAYGAGIVVYAFVRKDSRNACVDGGDCRALRMADRFKASVSVAGSAALGAVASFTLLPCSGGPYLAFATIISVAGIAERLALLLIYNLVFILPLAAILAGMVGVSRVRGVQEALVRHQRTLMAVAGIALILLGLYVSYLT
ncbi:MAG: hypothetical protein J7L55_02555 [Desulfurococcales archaeon]|nr:hypothetical protein [Desulfurococcales archaeon]